MIIRVTILKMVIEANLITEVSTIMEVTQVEVINFLVVEVKIEILIQMIGSPVAIIVVILIILKGIVLL